VEEMTSGEEISAVVILEAAISEEVEILVVVATGKNAKICFKLDDLRHGSHIQKNQF
jgi:hypothetical protein